jgi:hypothetical protein
MAIAEIAARAWRDMRSRIMARRRDSYRLTFGMAENRTAAQEHVVGDLARFCRADRSCFETDPRAHALAEGRREVWLRINQMLQLSDEQITNLAEVRDNDDTSYG